jgi:hypothetical protein
MGCSSLFPENRPAAFVAFHKQQLGVKAPGKQPFRQYAAPEQRFDVVYQN